MRRIDLWVTVVDERFQRCGIGRSASKAVAIRALQLMFAQVGPTNRQADLSVR